MLTTVKTCIFIKYVAEEKCKTLGLKVQECGEKSSIILHFVINTFWNFSGTVPPQQQNNDKTT